MKQLCSTYVIVALLLLTALPAAAEGPGMGPGWGWHGGHGTGEMGPAPFGDYCPRRHADRYGARQPVSTWEDAQERLRLFYKIPATQITLRKERRMGYIVDITNPDGTLSDRIIIDKRTGRIRSIR